MMMGEVMALMMSEGMVTCSVVVSVHAMLL
jgi:hypothetical protein